jgi:hypothetical protein
MKAFSQNNNPMRVSTSAGIVCEFQLCVWDAEMDFPGKGIGLALAQESSLS